MSLINTSNDFFALDIASDGVRAVQLKGSGKKTLHRYASKPIDVKVSQSDAPADKQKLMEAVKALMKEANVSSKNVVVSIPAGRSFVTVVDMPKLEAKDMGKSIEYQADQFIPMKIDEAKVDWALLGDSPEGSDKSEVLIASVANDYAESRLDVLESLGLNVVAMEPEQIALVRSLIPPETKDAAIILDMGHLSTNLVAVYEGAPRLIRSIPTGSEALIKAATQNLGVDREQADQFVFKFGLVKDKLEGQVYKAIQHIVDGLVEEVDKSIKFFHTRYQGTKIAKIIVTGDLAVLPEFPLYLVNHSQIPVEIGNSWININYNQAMTNQLASVSHQFSVAVGLAEREL